MCKASKGLKIEFLKKSKSKTKFSISIITMQGRKEENVSF